MSMKIITYVNAPHELDLRDIETMLEHAQKNPKASIEIVDVDDEPVLVMYEGKEDELLEALREDMNLPMEEIVRRSTKS